jgi:hypothetical protein
MNKDIEVIRDALNWLVSPPDASVDKRMRENYAKGAFEALARIEEKLEGKRPKDLKPRAITSG